MKNSSRYHLFIVLSTISRNLIELFSLVFLYQMGYDIKSILFFLFVMYSFGILSNSLGIYLANKIGYKYVLILSSILFAFSYYYLSVMSPTSISLVVLAILLSFGNYMYHVMRHYMAMLIQIVEINYILIWNYIGIMFTSLVGAYITNRFSLSFNVGLVVILSFISMVPLFKIHDDVGKKLEFSSVRLGNKTKFFVMEQFKVVFCELQGLFLFLHIEDNLIYLGMFQLFVGIASILFLFYFNRVKKDIRYFKYFNFLLCVVLLVKIHLVNKYFMYVVALLEGVCLKEFEYFSTLNLYDRGNWAIGGYLMKSEIIFSISKSVIVLFFYLFLNHLYFVMLICIGGIFLCSFLYPKEKVE